jgi:hypothetical protein
MPDTVFTSTQVGYWANRINPLVHIEIVHFVVSFAELSYDDKIIKGDSKR